MATISFIQEDVDFVVTNQNKLKKWIKDIILERNKKLVEITFVFCSDNYLLALNQQYLNHDTYTDVITFDNSDDFEDIEGDIFISIDRVMENADKFHHTTENELHRVMVHGVLHLIGFEDKNTIQKEEMTREEDKCLLKLK